MRLVPQLFCRSTEAKYWCVKWPLASRLTGMKEMKHKPQNYAYYAQLFRLCADDTDMANPTICMHTFSADAVLVITNH